VTEKEIKNGVKNGYCKTPRMKNGQKGMQNAFYMVLKCWQVLSTFKHPLKGLGEIIFMSFSLK